MNAPLTTAVAADKLRKLDLVNKAKQQAASEDAAEGAAYDSTRNKEITAHDDPWSKEIATVETESKTTDVVKRSGTSCSAKELSPAVTRWTYPIYTAVRRGHRKVVEYLLQRGAVFNIVDYDGSSPLHVATVYACQASESSLTGNGSE